MQDVSRRNSFPIAAIAVLSLLLAIGGCNQPGTRVEPGHGSQTTAPATTDTEAVAAQGSHAIKQEVTVTAPVVRILPEDRVGLMHQKFLIQLSNGTTVLIAHDISKAPEVPIKEGDLVRIHGEYIWNTKGGLIHWTHHSTSPRHEGGYIEFNGQRYE